MDTFLVAFTTVLPLFIVIIIGMIFSRVKVNHDNWIEVLNKYALWIGFPALVIFSLLKLDSSEKSYASFILLNSVLITGSLILVFPVSKIFGLTKTFKRTLFLILPFGNVSYLGIPILFNAFGEKILPEAAIISAVYVFFLFTIALFLVEIYGDEKTDIKRLGLRLIKNPMLLSVFIGLIIVLLKIKMPDFTIKTIELFAESVTAVVLFSLGIFLGMQKTGKLKEWFRVFFIVVVTMLILPFILYQSVLFFNLEVYGLKTTVIEAAMPLGVTPYVLSVQYKLKTTLVARVIVLGTLLSVIIIPLWMMWLG